MHRVPITAEEAFSLSGRVLGSGRALPAPSTALYGPGRAGAALAPNERSEVPSEPSLARSVASCPHGERTSDSPKERAKGKGHEEFPPFVWRNKRGVAGVTGVASFI